MESITGGLLGSQLTDVPGSSGYFRGGILAYSAEAKIRHGVDESLVAQYGTVDERVAVAMATAARRAFDADVGLATTGVAGPDPLEGHPPGTIIAAIDLLGETRAERQQWRTTRLENKRRAALAALNLAWRSLRSTSAAP
jgi:PncC family amidohydrolase